ncbi:ABC transporter permease [Sphaerisporangium sp. TRM90804]|uniref:ABC transporter permease n=1 Tax=Sphaerisporangium sp. TRM90804 TaxID=3031113 RepID=UPI00244693BC|nr:ABC transporter permease [Sphaerisporangium sp. TRM90804]MDH2425523.1 ABC transporter permease [Sphaerisporangium sp. TRM90804]
MTTTDTSPATPRVAGGRWAGTRKLTLMEFKLYLREPAALFFTILLPVGLLLILGSAIPGFQEPDPARGGERVVDSHLPAMMILLSVGTSAFSAIPAALATYRERGILRRLSATPLSPVRLLAAQLLVNLTTAVVAVVVTIGLGNLVLGTRVPERPVWFAVAFTLGVCALFVLGLCVAAVVPNSRVAGGIGAAVLFPLLFFAGMWLPRELMPEALRTVSDFTPTGAFGQAMRDAWLGGTPQVLHLAVLVAWTAVAALVAARLFRWE